MAKIVFHSASLRGGGAERVFALMANEMARRGHSVRLFTWNGSGPNAAILSSAVELVDLGLTIKGEGYGKLATISAITQTAAFIRQWKPDAVFSAPEFANLTMTIALRLAQSPARFFPSFHAAASLPGQALGAQLAVQLSRFVAQRASLAIAVSSGVRDDLLERGYDGTRAIVIHNPVPEPSTVADQVARIWRTRLDDLGAGPIIMTAGRLVAVKDHQTLLIAFKKVRDYRPARLLICGEGPLGEPLKALAQDLGISPHVHFAGYVDDLAPCYAVADLVVLSSTSEGFGNVLVEGMAAGRTVVSTDAGPGPREILDAGRFGQLVPVGDPSALAEAIQRAIEAPQSADRLKKRAAAFSTRTIGDHYEALLSL